MLKALLNIGILDLEKSFKMLPLFFEELMHDHFYLKIAYTMEFFARFSHLVGQSNFYISNPLWQKMPFFLY